MTQQKMKEIATTNVFASNVIIPAGELKNLEISFRNIIFIHSNQSSLNSIVSKVSLHIVYIICANLNQFYLSCLNVPINKYIYLCVDILVAIYPAGTQPKINVVTTLEQRPDVIGNTLFITRRDL